MLNSATEKTGTRGAKIKNRGETNEKTLWATCDVDSSHSAVRSTNSEALRQL
jgi:hypothetical protein